MIAARRDIVVPASLASDAQALVTSSSNSVHSCSRRNSKPWNSAMVSAERWVSTNVSASSSAAWGKNRL